MHEKISPISDRALEMIMLDVLDGLEEFALRAALESAPDCCEVLFICPPMPDDSPSRHPHGDAHVVDLALYKKAVGD